MTLKQLQDDKYAIIFSLANQSQQGDENVNTELKSELIEDMLDELECASITMRSLPTGSEEHHEAYLHCRAIQLRIKEAKSK